LERVIIDLFAGGEALLSACGGLQLQSIVKHIGQVGGSGWELTLAGAALRCLDGTGEARSGWRLGSIIQLIARASVQQWRWDRHGHVLSSM
jgi:hypothetical protein